MSPEEAWGRSSLRRLKPVNGVFQPGVIVSSKNEKVREYRKLLKKTFRHEAGKFLAEGLQAVREALNSDAGIECLFFTEEGEGHLTAYADIIRRKGMKAYRVSGPVFDKLSTTSNPQGLLAVVDFLDRSTGDILEADREPQILVNQVRDPGNVGAIIRAADAAGAGAVLLGTQSVDLYNPKTVRATAGSIFHIPIALEVDLPAYILLLKQRGVKLIAAEAKAETGIWEADLREPLAVMVGNEAWGFSGGEEQLADERVGIPIFGRAESLNVAEATSVFLYEIRRQREAR